MVGDEVYSEFKDYLKSKGFSYDLQSVKFLADLKKIMEIEGLSELAKDEIASLEKKLQSNLDYSLIHFEKDVKDLLATEILSRYYGQKGEIIYGLREDVDIKEAVEVLRSSNRYKEILSPEKK
jgi:carboxyl-terminal processing protease